MRRKVNNMEFIKKHQEIFEKRRLFISEKYNEQRELEKRIHELNSSLESAEAKYRSELSNDSLKQAKVLRQEKKRLELEYKDVREELKMLSESYHMNYDPSLIVEEFKEICTSKEIDKDIEEIGKLNKELEQKRKALQTKYNEICDSADEIMGKVSDLNLTFAKRKELVDEIIDVLNIPMGNLMEIGLGGYYGRPTRDTIRRNPVSDDKTAIQGIYGRG